MSMKPLIIFGDSSFAELAYEYFGEDSDFTPVAFTVEKKFITKSFLFGLDIIPFEELEYQQPYYMFIAVGYDKGKNDIKTRLYHEAKAKGFQLASYVSSKAFVWNNVVIGDNVFIMEDNTIQPFVSIGNNNTFWSGNHIGHHSTIGDNNFFSSHVVVCGHVTIGNNCFFGVNSSIANNISIPDRTFLKMGGIATKDYIYEMGKKRPYFQQ